MPLPPPAGSVIRFSGALFLCAACFQTGRWYQELSAPAPLHAAKADAGGEPAVAAPETPKTVEPAPLIGSGAPVGQSGDIITPLFARDPSALVMGPSSSLPVCPPQSLPDVEPAPSAKPSKPLKSGRLLELMEKREKKSAAPKSF